MNFLYSCNFFTLSSQCCLLVVPLIHQVQVPTLVTHVDEPSMTSTQRQPATIKSPQSSEKLVKPACVWKKTKKQVLSPPHSLCHFLLLSSVVVAVITQKQCGIPTASDLCCKGSQMSKKSLFQEIGFRLETHKLIVSESVWLRKLHIAALTSKNHYS